MESRKLYLYVINGEKDIVETKVMDFATGEEGDVSFFNVVQRFFEEKHRLIDYSPLGITFGMPRHLSWENISGHITTFGKPYEKALLSILEQGAFLIKDKDKIVGFLSEAENVLKYYQDRLGICSEHVAVSIQNIALIRKTINSLSAEAGELFTFSTNSSDKVLTSFKQVSTKTYGPFLKSLMPTKSENEINRLTLRVKGIAEDSIKVMRFSVNEYNVLCATFEPIDCYYANDGRLSEIMNVVDDHLEENVDVLRRLLNDIYYDMGISIPEKKEKMISLLKGLGVKDYEDIINKYYRFDVSERIINKARIKELKALCVMMRICGLSKIESKETVKKKIVDELVNLGYSNPIDYFNIYNVFEDNCYGNFIPLLLEVLDSIYFNEDVSLNSRRLWMIKEATDILGSREAAIEVLENNNDYYRFDIRECDVKKLYKFMGTNIK